ncbi:ABC transporter permease [Puia sp. P3]|uniref:ABC transporter permease n=1 Tax=Puia sp. P3 TaxID=3423952 RepID=UPI003D666275
MIRNYFLIAWRNLRKNKIYSAVNIIGLATGLAVFWLMALYVTDELSYDRYPPNASRIYRVTHSGQSGGNSFNLAITPSSFAPTLLNDYPEIGDAARIDAEGGGTLVYGDKKIQRNDIFAVDNSLLKIFGFPFLYGDAQNALSTPGSIVLTRTLAEQLFGKAEDALNKTIILDNQLPSKVTGVMHDLPANSHLSFSALRWLSPPTDNSLNSYLYTYILLKKDANPAALQSRLAGFYDRHLKARMQPGTQYAMELQPLTSIHLHSHLDYEMARNGDVRYVWLFSAIAFLVLIIAIINYINLATARSSLRLKEIGVRKVIGSGRRQLAILFLIESVFFTLLAAAIATVLATLLTPAFNTLSGKELSLWQFGAMRTITILITFTLATGLLGGAYPAAFLSGFHTLPSLKGQQGDLSGTILFRKSLVTFQFVVTVFLIAGSAIIYLQLRYMQHKDLGFNKDQVLSFHISNRDVREHIEDFKQQMLKDPSVQAAAAAGNPIGNNDIGSTALYFEQNTTTPVKVQTFYVDADYLPTLQIGLAAGRNFSATQPTDRFHSILINETLARRLGWANAIGKRVQWPNNGGETQFATIIGVVKDFNIYSLQHTIQPLVLQMPPVRKEEDNLCVRLNRSRITQGLQYIESVYKKWDATTPFEYHFLDDNFSRQYAAERRQGSLLLTFTALAILIACLGLFGLVTFSVGQRTKEIGVRKVLGASVTRIVLLVSKDLIKPVLLASAISIPLAWFATSRWLQGFAYHISLNIVVFLTAGIVAALIAMFTVGWQAMRAARANPAESLRTE